MIPLHQIVGPRPTFTRQVLVSDERAELDREHREMVRSILPWWRRIFWW